MSRYTVRHNIGTTQWTGGTRPDPVAAVDLTGGWRPWLWLGAPAPGGLALPPAQPSRAWMYSPRGVFVGDDTVVVADSGNHRVLIWHGMPDADEQPADVVLGQPDGESEGRAAGGRGPERGMNLPTGVLVHEGRLIVADAWHHRVLVWDSVPDRDDVAPDLVLGQPDASSVQENRGGHCSASTLYWPFGIAVIGSEFWVADTGNRRVLGWRGGIPDPDQPADIVLGQPDGAARDENRGGPAGPASFRWPHDITGTDDLLLVADAGDHRILGWSPVPDADREADMVLGQPDFGSSEEWPYGPHTGDRFRFPYAVCLTGGQERSDSGIGSGGQERSDSGIGSGGQERSDSGIGSGGQERSDSGISPGPGTPDVLAVADTANNRVLLWDSVPTDNRAADHVLAQPDFASNGENRWSSVRPDTLCWPYGLSMRGDTLAVADSGNNRVMLWRRGGAG